jgi:hypothetical protein
MIALLTNAVPTVLRDAQYFADVLSSIRICCRVLTTWVKFEVEFIRCTNPVCRGGSTWIPLFIIQLEVVNALLINYKPYRQNLCLKPRKIFLKTYVDAPHALKISQNHKLRAIAKLRVDSRLH